MLYFASVKHRLFWFLKRNSMFYCWFLFQVNWATSYIVGLLCLRYRPPNIQAGTKDGWPPLPGSYRQDSGATCSEEELPPPPPPIFEEETRRQRARLTREQRDDTMATGTSKSTTSAASITLTSNASIMSSQTEESEEEDKKKVGAVRKALVCLGWDDWH